VVRRRARKCRGWSACEAEGGGGRIYPELRHVIARRGGVEGVNPHEKERVVRREHGRGEKEGAGAAGSLVESDLITSGRRSGDDARADVVGRGGLRAGGIVETRPEYSARTQAGDVREPHEEGEIPRAAGGVSA